MAREALSARVDGEHEPVPSARVDEHVAGCAECCAWRDAMTGQAARLHRLAADPPLTGVVTPRATAVRRGWGWPRWALLVVGGGQLALAAVQGFGLDVGLVHGGMVMSGHLLNESTAWSLALGAISLITEAPYAVAATALTPVKAFRLDRAAITAAIAERPSLTEGLEELARRGQAAISADLAAARDHRDERPDLFLSRMRGFLQKLGAGLGPTTPR